MENLVLSHLSESVLCNFTEDADLRCSDSIGMHCPYEEGYAFVPTVNL